MKNLIILAFTIILSPNVFADFIYAEWNIKIPEGTNLSDQAEMEVVKKVEIENIEQVGFDGEFVVFKITGAIDGIRLAEDGKDGMSIRFLPGRIWGKGKYQDFSGSLLFKRSGNLRNEVIQTLRLKFVDNQVMGRLERFKVENTVDFVCNRRRCGPADYNTVDLVYEKVIPIKKELFKYIYND